MQIEISPKEKFFIVSGLILHIGALKKQIATKKKNKDKYRLKDDEKDLKEAQALLKFFDRSK